jgi:phosphotransferase system HPr (HPr) family protein
VTRQLTLTNEHGLHARPATELVRCAAAFESTITISAKGKRYRADRIMEVLLADLNRGDTFVLQAVGADAIQAVERIGQLVASLRELEEKMRRLKNREGEVPD